MMNRSNSLSPSGQPFVERYETTLYFFLIVLAGAFGAAMALTGCEAAPSSVDNFGGDYSTSTSSDPDNDKNGDGDAGSSTSTGNPSPVPSGSPTNISCRSVADCPAPATACAMNRCISGLCWELNAREGSLAGIQSLGDCKVNVCDGRGGVVARPDDADMPEPSGNECVRRECDDGLLVSMALPARTECNYGICNGLGDCVECLDDIDCPESHCVEGNCGLW